MAKLSEAKIPEELGDFIKSNKVLRATKRSENFTLEPEKDYFTKDFSSELDVAKFNDAKIRNAIAKQLDGVKYDNGKPRWDLLPIAEIEDRVKILTFGAEKYAPNNWQKIEPNRYVAAAFRHFTAWLKGDCVDSESGLSHLAHAGCNILFLMWFEKHGMIDKSLFDLNRVDNK